MRTMPGWRACVALGVCSLVACGGGASQATTPKTPTPAPAAPAPSTPAESTAGLALDLGEVTVYDGDEALLKLHADGTTELGAKQDGAIRWVPGPTFRTDGSLLVEGQLRARLTGQGIAIAGSEQVLPLAVSADEVKVESVSFSLAADGALRVIGLDTGGTRLRFEAESSQKRHTGLVVWTALFVIAQAEHGAR
jgi:hypothetical protein